MKKALSKRKMVLLIGLVSLLFTVVFFTIESKICFIKRLDNISSNSNPLIRHFSPTWRSLKKIVDLPYLTASPFMTVDLLPVYEIKLSKNDRYNLLNELPDYPKENRLNEEFKKTIKAEFRYGSYVANDAKIRYRGTSPDHWNAIKKSWQVDLPKKAPLGDRTVLRFFIGGDKGWIIGFLWEHLAKKLHLLAPSFDAVELMVDKKSMGVYTLVEGWEESFFEKNGRQIGRFMTNKSLALHKPDFLLVESVPFWYDRNEKTRDAATIPEFNYFLWLVSAAPNDVFAKEIENILDMDYFLRWTLAAIFSGNFHQGNGSNLNFYINPATGKFEPIFFDASSAKIGDVINVSDHRLVNRVLQIDRYRAQFEQIARAYVEDSSNIADDLSFYDAKTAALLPAIYRDTQKIQTSFEVRETIRANRETYQHNIVALQSMFEKNGALAFHYANETYPISQSPDSFVSFHAISASRGEFLAAYPQFVAGQKPDSVILLPGSYLFSHDVIIPKGLRVTIREGVRIFFGPSISLVSYSPIEAIGTRSQPISINRLLPEKPWGVVATINTNQKNIFRNVRLNGGSGATINGLSLSGMLSVHGGDLEFRNGIIENAGADDGIHILSGEAIITDTLFGNNSSDGIDIDFASEGSLIASNRFLLSPKKNPNGDAIDLSFSAPLVKDNVINGCSDKGVSVGEASMPRIENNIIKRCAYGIAVKDRSEATIIKNIFENNEIAIGLYRKKPHFISGGTAILTENTFIGNKQDTSVDEYSKIIK